MLGNCQFSAGEQSSNKNVASCDTDDDIFISSALLITSTLHQRRQVNVRKCQRNSWIGEWITAQRQSEKLTKNRDGLYPEN